MVFERKLKRDNYKKMYTYFHYFLIIFLLSFCASLQVNASTPISWPWLAYIPSLNCTGSIVHSRWLLTTSSCFQNKSTVPSELLIQVQDLNPTTKGVRLIYVIDYTREDIPGHRFTMLYLAQTVPSLTQNVVAMRANNANAPMDKKGIVLSWDAGRANSGSTAVNILALAVDLVPCVVDSARFVCVSLRTHHASSSGVLQHCSRLRLGSPLVVTDANGLATLAGVLQENSACQPHSYFIGKFSPINYGRKWIRRQFRVQDFPQCQPNVYRTLDDPSRDLGKTRDGFSVLCDTEIQRAWYRFQLNGKPAELPTVCPASNACGTSSSVWLPQADVIKLGKQVEIKACASWQIGSRRICCFWKLTVFVRHCGDFKVYRLRRTDFCPTSYCVDVANGLCLPGQTGYKPNCKDSYPKLTKVLQLYPFYAYQGNPKRSYVYLRCLLYGAKKEETVKYLFNMYKIKKGKGGERTKILVRKLETTRRYFDVRLIPQRYSVELGDTVVCEVRSFFKSTKNIKSPALASQDYHLGIKVQPSSTLVLTYPNIINITLTITLPVICHVMDESCSLTIPLTTSLIDDKTGKLLSPGSHFFLSKCSLVYTTERCSRDNINCGRKTIQIQAGKNFELSVLKLRINLGPIISTDSVWKDHSFPAIEAVLKTTPRFSCYSVSASNIKTFGGSFYKHLGEGSFLFYGNTLSSTEVQIQKWLCNGISACPCAVAIREGNDVIVADMCHGQHKQSSLRFIIRSKLPLHRNTKILESSNGRSFVIQLPSGSQINIDEFYWGISVYLSVTDVGDHQDLCRGVTSPAQLSMKSLFNDSSIPLNRPRTTTRDFCSCSGSKSLNQSRQPCPSSNAFSHDTEIQDITAKITNKQQILLKGFSLRKRAQFEHEEPLQADAPSQSLSFKRREEICHKILNSSDPLLVCKKILGKELWEKFWKICIEETQEGLDMDLLRSNSDTLTRVCQQKIEEMKDDQILQRRWESEMCQNRCGQNGHCYRGNCKCNAGYGSTDCSVHLNTPPQLFPLEDPLCDARDEICEEIFISGTPFLNFGSLSCSFTPVQRTDETWIEDKYGIFTAKAIYYSMRGVICRIPENQRSNFVKSYEALHIRVSNSGYQWSNPVLRVSYDSLCKNCSNTEKCETKPWTCSIGSRCFFDGDLSLKNSCFKCSSKDDPHKWTPRSDNLPPLFNAPTEDTITVLLGDVISFIVNVTDPENKPLKITHDVRQARLSSDGKFRWKPDKETTRTIRLKATDDCGRTSSKFIDVIVHACSCKNGGSCVKTSKNDFKCSCPKMFKGVYCEMKDSPCEPSPCSHGKCEKVGDNFRCICIAGYHGNLCQLKLPACHSSPCKRGKCEEHFDGYRCKCPRFYGGRRCEIELNICASDPCVRGHCYGNDNKSFECVCPPGFHGKLCSKRTTACSPNPCHRGRCIVLGSSMRCVCPPTHHGKFCNLTGLYCGDTRCVNGACDATGQKCVCRKGYIGEQCDAVCSIDCVNGECSRTPRRTVCECHAGYTGPSCRIRTKPCDSSSCVHGICVNLSLHYLCHCYPGYSGTSCNISSCSTVDCHNGTCILVSGHPVCRCLKGYVGDFCDRRRQPCDANPCQHGVCIATNGYSFKCSCNPGFHGDLCGERIDPCSSKPCGDGTCNSTSNGAFNCTCPPGYVDLYCKEKPKTNLCHLNPCVHGKCEVVSDTDFLCNCERSYVGRLCEKRFNICASSPCVNGHCSSLLEGTFTCTCNTGFSGTLCQIDRRPCSKNPCYKGVSCTNVNEQTFRCAECPSGYVGDGINCRAVNEKVKSFSLPCPRQFCFPGVQCSIVSSRIHCGACPRGYLGNGFQCRVLCEMPCQNGGTCVLPGVCRCYQGFIGPTCARAFCKRSCLNGGRCIAPGKCRCPMAYYGDRCQIARCNVKCKNGGKCIPPGKCRCLPGYMGATCEQAVCALQCLNGGQCVSPGTCRCMPGYFGTRCQEGTCTPQCRNGGICVRNNVCSCPEGYRGSRCQTAVCQRPCQNGGRCFKKDQCTCPYGYWGKVCQYVYCLRPCLNGGVCIKPSVCLCPGEYAGVTCEFYVG